MRAALPATVLAAIALPAQAMADDVVSRTLGQSAAEVRDFWTPERMERARPASVRLSAPRRAGLVDRLSGDGRTRAAAPVTSPTSGANKTHGKVFFSDGGLFQCSGTAVTARTKRLVVTAGHCMYDGGFASNWIFIPAKDGGSEPFGRWAAARLATTSQWANSTEDANPANDNVRYDVGFATMRKRNGRRLQKVIGARGMTFEQTPGNVDAFGYPAEDPFNGSEPYVCPSAVGRDPFMSASPRPYGIDCDMTPGSSGGGWIAGGRVNSVTSYGYEPSCPLLCSDPDGDKLYGPVFGTVIKDLYRSQRRKRR